MIPRNIYTDFYSKHSDFKLLDTPFPQIKEVKVPFVSSLIVKKLKKMKLVNDKLGSLIKPKLNFSHFHYPHQIPLSSLQVKEDTISHKAEMILVDVDQLMFQFHTFDLKMNTLPFPNFGVIELTFSENPFSRINLPQTTLQPLRDFTVLDSKELFFNTGLENDKITINIEHMDYVMDESFIYQHSLEFNLPSISFEDKKKNRIFNNFKMDLSFGECEKQQNSFSLPISQQHKQIHFPTDFELPEIEHERELMKEIIIPECTIKSSTNSSLSFLYKQAIQQIQKIDNEKELLTRLGDPKGIPFPKIDDCIQYSLLFPYFTKRFYYISYTLTQFELKTTPFTTVISTHACSKLQLFQKCPFETQPLHFDFEFDKYSLEKAHTLNSDETIIEDNIISPNINTNKVGTGDISDNEIEAILKEMEIMKENKSIGNKTPSIKTINKVIPRNKNSSKDYERNTMSIKKNDDIYPTSNDNQFNKLQKRKFFQFKNPKKEIDKITNLLDNYSFELPFSNEIQQMFSTQIKEKLLESKFKIKKSNDDKKTIAISSSSVVSTKNKTTTPLSKSKSKYTIKSKFSINSNSPKLKTINTTLLQSLKDKVDEYFHITTEPHAMKISEFEVIQPWQIHSQNVFKTNFQPTIPAEVLLSLSRYFHTTKSNALNEDYISTIKDIVSHHEYFIPTSCCFFNTISVILISYLKIKPNAHIAIISEKDTHLPITQLLQHYLSSSFLCTFDYIENEWNKENKKSTITFFTKNHNFENNFDIIFSVDIKLQVNDQQFFTFFHTDWFLNDIKRINNSIDSLKGFTHSQFDSIYSTPSPAKLQLLEVLVKESGGIKKVQNNLTNKKDDWKTMAIHTLIETESITETLKIIPNNQIDYISIREYVEVGIVEENEMQIAVEKWRKQLKSGFYYIISTNPLIQGNRLSEIVWKGCSDILLINPKHMNLVSCIGELCIINSIHLTILSSGLCEHPFLCTSSLISELQHHKIVNSTNLAKIYKEACKREIKSYIPPTKVEEEGEYHFIVNETMEEMFIENALGNIKCRNIGFDCILCGISTIIVIIHGEWKHWKEELYSSNIKRKIKGNDVVICFVAPMIDAISKFLDIQDLFHYFNNEQCCFVENVDQLVSIARNKNEMVCINDNCDWLIDNESNHEHILNLIDGFHSYSSQFMLLTTDLHVMMVAEESDLESSFGSVLPHENLVCPCIVSCFNIVETFI